MKLYELTQEDKKLEELFLESIDESTGEIKASKTLDVLQEELKIELQNKSTSIVKVLRDMETDIESIENEIKRLELLKSSYSKNKEKFEKYVTYNMREMGVKEVKTSIGVLTTSETTTTDVFDINLLPNEFKREKVDVKINPDKNSIKKAIKSGIEVPGARLKINHNLRIK